MKAISKKKLLWVLLPLLALVLVGGGAFYWMLSGTSAPPLALQARTSVATTTTDAALSGHWTVVAGPADQPTTAGYRVVEKVAGGLASDTATGRTGDVTGSATVVGTKVTAATFTVNMTTLKSDKSLRDSVLKTVGIQTSKYPTATFTLTNPVALPEITPGKIYQVNARGTLQLHGVSKSVSISLQYQQTETGFVVLADVPISMADYSITAPSIAGVVSVDHHGTFEIRVNLAK
ncbi:MAG: YceI-like domain protein [Mycobacterium sp.]|jgi:polyisoprenoid-binding protein YceI|nr:YceI-like domain protein [Mycobacterium sp.]